MLLTAPRIAALAWGLLIAAPGLFCQDAAAPGPRPGETQGIPPRATPADYQAHAQAGAVTIAAEFLGHSVPTPQSTLLSEEFVVVEVAVFGAPDARIAMTPNDFSLRVNKKKTTLPQQHWGLVVGGLKDPELEPPASEKSKTSMSGSGGVGNGEESNSEKKAFKIPFEVKRAMSQRTQRASLAVGDRPLPQAGLVFFSYRGKAKDIEALELTYEGSAGTVTFALQP